MSTTTCGKTTFHHNSDLSGDVTMTYEGDEKHRYTIPANDLLEFVAEHLRRLKIAELESQEWPAILGGSLRLPGGGAEG